MRYNGLTLTDTFACVYLVYLKTKIWIFFKRKRLKIKFNLNHAYDNHLLEAHESNADRQHSFSVLVERF